MPLHQAASGLPPYHPDSSSLSMCSVGRGGAGGGLSALHSWETEAGEGSEPPSIPSGVSSASSLFLTPAPVPSLSVSRALGQATADLSSGQLWPAVLEQTGLLQLLEQGAWQLKPQ
jgi:hypothetical protein